MRTQHQFLEENIGTSQDENYAFWLVTLLSWLLPTLVIALGLLDPLLAYVLSKKKRQKEQAIESQMKVVQLLTQTFLFIYGVGGKIMFFAPVIGIFYSITHYHAATFSLTQDTLTNFNADSKWLEK